MTAAIEEEVSSLLGHADFTGALDWDGFATAWWRIVRRIVLGDGAREDERLTDDLRRLRERGNFAHLAPQDRRRRECFLRGLEGHVDRAEPGSLAELVAREPADGDAAPVQQIPQWLFAFDAAAWATFRALALVTAHPDTAEAARAEMSGAPELPLLRASVLESLRLWPTTPLLLRDTTEETTWSSGTLSARAPASSCSRPTSTATSASRANARIASRRTSGPTASSRRPRSWSPSAAGPGCARAATWSC